MSAHKVLKELGQAMNTPTVKTATATLTRDDMASGIVIAAHPSSAIALTLPPPAQCINDAPCLIADGGAAAVTVLSDAGSVGFGGAGGSYDTLTFARGDAALVFAREVSGTAYWFYVHATVAAG